MAQKSIYFVQHGRYHKKAFPEGRSLTEKGIEDATKAGRTLTEKCLGNGALVLYSQQPWIKQTAEIIGQEIDADTHESSILYEASSLVLGIRNLDDWIRSIEDELAIESETSLVLVTKPAMIRAVRNSNGLGIDTFNASRHYGRIAEYAGTWENPDFKGPLEIPAPALRTA